MKRVTRRGTSLVGTIVIAIAANGCVPHVEEQVTHTPQAASAPVKATETRAADAEVTAKASGNLVAVKVMDRKECRDILRTPMERVDETKRTLDNGVIAQGTNLVLAGGLAALGIAVLANTGGSCSKTPDATAQNPNPASRPCTADEQKEEKTGNTAVGWSSIGLSAIPLGLFVWNIFRAKDERTTAPLEPKREESGWKTCMTQPIANTPIVLTAGSTTVNGRTNAQGEATLDVSPIASAGIDKDPVNAQVTAGVANGTSVSASVTLTDTPAYGTWKAAVLKDANAKKAEESVKTASADIDQIEQAFTEVERILTELERARDPWGDTEISKATRYQQVIAPVLPVLRSLAERTDLDSRTAALVLALRQRVDRIGTRISSAGTHLERAEAARNVRDGQKADREARQQAADHAAAERKKYPLCMQCCLSKSAFATRDHCQTTCVADPDRYLDYSSFARAYGNGKIEYYCKQ